MIYQLTDLLTTMPQQIFDHCARHLLRQNKRCEFNFPFAGPRSMWRHPYQDLRCAIGACMSEADLREAARNWQDDLLHLPIYYALSPDRQTLLLAVQEVHDLGFPYDWPIQLRELAESMGLSASVVD